MGNEGTRRFRNFLLFLYFSAMSPLNLPIFLWLQIQLYGKSLTLILALTWPLGMFLYGLMLWLNFRFLKKLIPQLEWMRFARSVFHPLNILPASLMAGLLVYSLAVKSGVGFFFYFIPISVLWAAMLMIQNVRLIRAMTKAA